MGDYRDAANLFHGFIYNTDGTYTTLNAPGGVFFTELFGINNEGQIVGIGIGNDQNTSAFLYSGGTFTRIYGGAPSGINDSGTILTAGNQGTGVLYPNGDFAYIQPQLLPYPLSGINNAGEIAGGGAILTPVPEPKCLFLVLAAFSFITVRRLSSDLFGRIR